MLTVADILRAAAARSPNAIAIVDGDRQVSYAELLATSSRIAGRLRRMNLGDGDRLLVVMQNRLETVVLFWAAQLSGSVFTPINWRAKPTEIAFFLKDSGARALAHCPAARAAADIARHHGVPVVDLCNERGAIDDQLGLVERGGEVRALPEAASLMFYTSGTTGTGKGVPRSHRAERAAAVAHVAQNAYLKGESMLGVMPLYHTMGIRSLLATALVDGLFVCQRRFDAGTSIALVETHRLSALYLVPTLYHDILSHPSFVGADVSCVRKLGFAGAPMTQDLLQRVHAAFRPDLFVNHYGSTEIYTFTVNQDAAGKPGSAGRAGLNSQIRIVPIDSKDADAPVPAGVTGQIAALLDSDEAFSGYWNRPDADARAISGAWYLTGDIGHFDEEGDLFVTGRVDDMIISGGENILPAEIESLLSLHPDASEVAVVGLPDERLGQRVTAFIRPRGTWPGAETFDAFCRASDLADYKRPRGYVEVESLPRSPVGKLLRRLLVAERSAGEVSGV